MKEKEIETVIRAFVTSGDRQDPAALEPVLHEHFRLNLRNADGTVALLPRAAYLNLLREKKIGGVPRAITISAIRLINDVIATANATLKSDALKFDAQYSLLKTAAGQWQLIQDMPVVEPVTEPVAKPVAEPVTKPVTQ